MTPFIAINLVPKKKLIFHLIVFKQKYVNTYAKYPSVFNINQENNVIAKKTKGE